MAHSFSPFGTPSIPSAPHPTPSSSLSQKYRTFNPRLPRPPVQNPFDKFKQPDFDAWIGKLTGDLEKALGYDTIEQPQSEVVPPGADTQTTRAVGAKSQTDEEDYLEGDSYVEDSFAEVKARRADKGKARDPREGPGLGPKSGDHDQPIEILSDEENEDGSSQILSSDASEAEEDEQEGDEEYDEEGESDEEEGEIAESSARVREDWIRSRRRAEVDSKNGSVLSGEEYEGEESYEEYDEEEGERNGGSAEEVIELLSDGDSPAPASKRQHEEEEEFLSDEGAADARSSPAQFDDDAEAYEEQGEMAAREVDEMQPSDDDTSFPPHASAKGELTSKLVDIRDPWAQVEKYAEDYYAEGEVINPRVKGPLAAHHLGVNKNIDDTVGFLTPDVVSNADLDDDEEREGKQGDDVLQDEPEEYYEEDEDEEYVRENEREADEQDHLFNRLQSYSNRSFGLSYTRRHQPPAVIAFGTGTNDEPIMIDSDDDEDSGPAPPRRRETEAEQDDEKFLEELGEDEYADASEEEGEGEEEEEDHVPVREYDGAPAQIVGSIDSGEDKTPALQTIEAVEGSREEITVVDVHADEIQEGEERVHPEVELAEEGIQPNVQPTTSTPHIHTVHMAQQPISEPSLLPTPPSEPEHGPVLTDSATQETLSLYDNVTIPPIVPSQDTQQDNSLSETIINWGLSYPVFFPLPSTDGLFDTPFPSRRNVPSSIPIPEHELDTTSANVDAHVFGFEDIVTSFDPSGDIQQPRLHPLVHTETRAEVSIPSGSACAVVEEVIDVDAESPEVGEEVDELDEEPGAFPLMTSDLAYPEHEEVQGEQEVGAMEYELQLSTPTSSEAVKTEERVVPEKVIEATEGGESDKESELRIFVEEPEEYWLGTPPEQITINIHAATPIPPSPAVATEDQFEESPASPEAQAVNESTELQGEPEVYAVPDAAASLALKGLPTKEGAAADEATFVDDEEETLTISVEEPLTEPVLRQEDSGKLAPEGEHADIIIPEMGTEREYTIVEPLTDSEYLASEGPSRAVSLGLVYMQSDEVIPPIVAIGDVEEVNSDIELEQGADSAEFTKFPAPKPSDCGGDGVDGEARSIIAETQFEVTEVADVRNAQWTTSLLELDDETHVEEAPAENVPADAYTVPPTTTTLTYYSLPAPSPTSADAPASPPVEPDGYFAQPGTPVMDYGGSMDFSFSRSPSGGLPTIIQLPGTPQKVLSPGGTLVRGPTPVSIAVDPVVLKALKVNPGLFSPPSLPTSSAQEVERDTSPDVPEHATATPAALTEGVAEVTEPIADISPADEAPAAQNVQQTSFLATTVPGKPILSVLYDDPYPYSLSTPGPQNEVDVSEEETSTEQDNSMSSASSAEKSSSSSSSFSATGELVYSNYAADMELHYPAPEITIPAEAAIDLSASVTNAASVTEEIVADDVLEKVLEVEKGLVDVEAEADKLIDEFLVDEPDSDTDADGEADPDFAGVAKGSPRSEERASEEIMIQEVAPETIVNVGEVEQPTPEERKEVVAERVEGKQNVEVATTAENVPLQQDEEDPFKLMGNGSLIALGEAPEPTIIQTIWEKEEEEESEDEAEVAAVFAKPEPEPTNVSPRETLPQSPQVRQTPVLVEVAPMTLTCMPPAPQALFPPASVSSPGHVGLVPYHVAAAANMQTMGSPLPSQWADRPTWSLPPLDSVTSAFFHSLQQYSELRPQPVTFQPSESTSTAMTPSTSLQTSLAQEIAPTAPGSKVEEPPRKIQISVEDPYQPDNDLGREPGPSSTSKAKKRKRSQSDTSSPEHPYTPIKLPSTVKKNETGGRIGQVRPSAKRGRKRSGLSETGMPSRSPSIASTILSEGSTQILLSPTQSSLADPEPRPFLHAHSRRKRGKVPTTLQEQMQKQRLPSSSGSRTGILRAGDVLIKAPSASSTTSTSSPVTRSHCRYHKITLPKTENGPRITFLVPGCSLNDEQLIREEEIIDHGEAIIKGDTRIVVDIETLDFEAYLHWVMRQLVGPEILRENEVFYLPEPGEEIVRNPHRPEKRKGVKPEKKRVKVPDDAAGSSTQHLNDDRSLDGAGSVTSSTASVLQQILDSESDNLSPVTEAEDEKSSPTKPGIHSIGEMGIIGINGSLTQDGSSAFSRKRSRRLGPDAAAYFPSSGSDEGDSTDFSDYEPNHKTPRGRGQKRSRTTESSTTDGTDGRKMKKPKTQVNRPQTQLSQSHTLVQPDHDVPEAEVSPSLVQPQLNPSEGSSHVA